MTRTLILLIGLFYLGVCNVLRGQHYIDSLEAIVTGKYHDTVKMSALSDLVEIHWKKDLRKAALFAKKNLSLAIRSGNERMMAKTYNEMAGTYYFMGDYKNALLYNIKTLQSKQKKMPDGSTVGTKKSISSTLVNIAHLYLNQAEYNKAIDCNLQALKLKEEIGDSIGIARVLSNIGNVYESVNNFPKAVEFQNRALKVSKAIGEEYIMASCYNNLGNVFIKTGESAKAKFSLEMAMELRKKIRDEEGLYTVYNNLGSFYFAQKDFANAQKYYEMAWAYYENTPDPLLKTSILVNLGDVYRHFRKYEKAEMYMKKAIQIAQKNRLTLIEKDACHNLAQMFKSAGNYERAYHYLFYYSSMVDTIFRIENSQRMAELQAKYDDAYKTNQLESMKKQQIASELENSRQEIELQKQRNIRNVSLVTIALMVIIGFLFYNRYTLRNKLNQQLEMQNRQIAEKNQDITNSITYAQRIQNAIIPSAKSVNRIFPENFILYRPKDIVAGDFYWCEEVGNRRFIAVADCTGHGVPGAMVSVVCSNALNRAVFEFNITEPGRILDKTRELIVETFSKNDEKVNDGMDISLLCFDGDKVSWSGANNSLVYVTNGVLKEIKAHKQPIGKSLINTPFPTHHMRLEQGTVFYLFSDGYADQFGGKDGKKFMYRNLLKEFHEISSLPLKEQGERLDMHFQSWRGPLEQLDDVCVIGIRS